MQQSYDLICGRCPTTYLIPFVRREMPKVGVYKVDWKQTDDVEMKTFIGLIILIALNNCVLRYPAVLLSNQIVSHQVFRVLHFDRTGKESKAAMSQKQLEVYLPSGISIHRMVMFLLSARWFKGNQFYSKGLSGLRSEG